MARDDERLSRSQQELLVGGLPELPGILTALNLTPALGVHLRGLADELLVHDHPGATISRAEREMLATAVSAGNNCFYCMDSHGAFATALLQKGGDEEPRARRRHHQAGRLGRAGRRRCRRCSTSRGPSAATAST